MIRVFFLVFIAFWSQTQAKTLQLHETPFLDNNLEEYQVYDDYIIAHNKNLIAVLNKDSSLKWKAAVTSNNIEELQVSFDTIFWNNNKHEFNKMDIDINVEETLSYLFPVKHFVIQYPYVIVVDDNKKYSLIDIAQQQPIWEKKKLNCKNTFFMSTSEYFGCVGKNKLEIYDTMTSNLVFKTLLVNQDWTLKSLYNQGAFFIKGHDIVDVNIKNKEVSPLDIKPTYMVDIVRQKDILITDKEQKMLFCTDLKSKKNMWTYTADNKFKHIVSTKKHVMIQFPSQNVVILDHFSGEKTVTFNSQYDLSSINSFYEENNKWVFLQGKKLYTLE